jgi:hypothetical protein
MYAKAFPRLSVLRVLRLSVIAALSIVWSGPIQGANNEQQLAPGVSYESIDVDTPRGVARAHVVEIDLRHPKVGVDLLYPGVVAERRPVSEMADERRAVAAVNGDFFNISVTQPGVVPTGAPVGPAVAAMHDLKGAVPTSQRFGPSLPPGDSVEDVIGVGVDRVGRLGRLTLHGKALSRDGWFDVRGLNQYAIAENGIGAFTSTWGEASRERAICGTDTRREDPCSTNVHEVTIRRGRVTATANEPGAGDIPHDTVVLLGRDEGANDLRQFDVGDPVHVRYDLASSERIPFWFAVGGQPIVRDDVPLPGLNDTVAATRSAAGISADGRRFFLLALDRNAAGMTYAELASLLRSVGAASGVNLDGGGSSTLVARDAGDAHVTVKNLAPGDAERPVPNGIGVFLVP